MSATSVGVLPSVDVRVNQVAARCTRFGSIPTSSGEPSRNTVCASISGPSQFVASDGRPSQRTASG